MGSLFITIIYGRIRASGQHRCRETEEGQSGGDSDPWERGRGGPPAPHIPFSSSADVLLPGIESQGTLTCPVKELLLRPSSALCFSIICLLLDLFLELTRAGAVESLRSHPLCLHLAGQEHPRTHHRRLAPRLRRSASGSLHCPCGWGEAVSCLLRPPLPACPAILPDLPASLAATLLSLQGRLTSSTPSESVVLTCTI